MGQKRKRPILLQVIVGMIVVAAVLWPATVWLYIENVGFETIRTAYEITSGRLLWFWLGNFLFACASHIDAGYCCWTMER